MVVISTNEVLKRWNQGASYYSQGKYDDAIVQYKKALSVNTDYAMQESLADAIRKCKIAQGDAKANIINAQGWNQQQVEYHNAITELNKVIKTPPTDISAYKNLGDVYYNQGKYADALYEYQAALTIETDFTEQGKLADAMRKCKEAQRMTTTISGICEDEQVDNDDDEMQSAGIIGL